MQYEQIGTAVRHLKVFGEDEIAAFQGLFLLAPKQHEKLVYRLSTEQTRVLLRMARDPARSRCYGRDHGRSESLKVAHDFTFLIKLLDPEDNY